MSEWKNLFFQFSAVCLKKTDKHFILQLENFKIVLRKFDLNIVNIIFIPCQYYVEPFIFDVLRDLVPFVQFKKRGKHPWRIVTISKVATLLEVTIYHEFFSHF